MPKKALNELKALDISQNISGPYCAKFLADFGAEVIKIETPNNGDPSRRLGPFPNNEPNSESSGFFFYLNTNKKSITLDLKSKNDSVKFKELISWADVLVENFRPGTLSGMGLGFETLKLINPGLILTSITDFGQTGPYKDYHADEITIQAMGEWLYYRGDSSRKPVMAAPKLGITQWIGGAFGAMATMSAVLHKERNGCGQHVDISLLECAIQMVPFYHTMLSFPRNIVPPGRMVFTPSVEICKDGYIGLNIMTGQQWADLCGMMEMYDWMNDINYSQQINRALRVNEVKDRMRPWLMERTRKEIIDEAIAWRVPAMMVLTSGEIVDFEVHKERSYIVDIKHPVMGDVKMPGPPFRMHKTPGEILRPAPLLGEHNKEISEKLRDSANNTNTDSRRNIKAHEHSDTTKKMKNELPLSGIRICDLTRFWSGPFCTSYLGGLGAEVIKVEAIQSTDGFRWTQTPGDKWWEISGQWCSINRNKLGITLDLNNPSGIELLQELIKKSDIVIENFPPRVMDNFNLSYTELKKLKEDIILVSMPGYGLTGPLINLPGFAFAFEQASGLASITGYTDAAPLLLGGAADPIIGIHAAYATQLAIEHHRKTGEGQLVEISQLEALTSLMGPAIIDFSVNKHVWHRQGNFNEKGAPHNVYRCAGNEKWIAISVRTEDEWNEFCKIIDKPEIIETPKFINVNARNKNKNELDQIIEKWTIKQDSHHIMETLQKAGIASGIVHDAHSLLKDPHLRDRGAFVTLDRDIVGKQVYSTFPFIFSEINMLNFPAPTLGQHNNYVLENILGLTKSKIKQLEQDKIIGTEPINTGL